MAKNSRLVEPKAVRGFAVNEMPICKRLRSRLSASDCQCPWSDDAADTIEQLYEALRMCLLNGNLDPQEREAGEAALAKARGEA